MIVEYIRYKIEAQQTTAFMTAYDAASVQLRASANCLGYQLAQCTDAKEEYTLRILWDSHEGHLKGFRGSELFKQFFTAVQPFTKQIAEMRHYDITSLNWSR